MRLDLDDDAFRTAAEAWLRTLGDDTIVSFGAVVEASPGYYPTTLHALWLAEIARRGVNGALPASASTRPAPEPFAHPEDADWRFTAESANRLLDIASHHLTPGACAAHIGTPTTFHIAARSDPGVHHVLLERSPLSITKLMKLGHEPSDLFCLDVTQADIPQLQAHLAIVDPPWYPDETAAFLTAASLVCRVGATILLCQPTPATRPAVRAERQQLEAALPDMGLSLRTTRPGDVRYLTPHFEAVSLRFANPQLPDLPSWRVGDLMILRKDRDITTPPPAARTASTWIDLQFGPVHLKVRSVADAAGDMATIVPGDLLSTVSRRDPVRNRVGLWTSGNRVYGLINATSIAQLVHACGEDLARHQFTLIRTLHHAKRLGVARSTARRLFDVLLIELQEHRAFERA